MLAALLRDLPPAGAGNAARCLHFLARGSEPRSFALVAAGALPAFERALSSGTDFTLAELTAFAIEAMAGASAGVCREIAGSEALKSLAALLRHSTPTAAGEAAAALAHLAAAGDDVRAALIASGAVPNLVSLLSHPLAPLAQKAEAVLRALASGASTQSMLTSGAVNKIVEKLNLTEVHKVDRSLKALVVLAGASRALAEAIRVRQSAGNAHLRRAA